MLIEKVAEKGEFIMWLNLTDLTEKDIQESCERMMNNRPVFTDMSDYYADKLYEIHKEHIAQKEETILGIPISEVERQCQAYHVESPFDQPLDPSQDPMDSVIEGGKKILNDPKTLKLVRGIYRHDDK